MAFYVVDGHVRWVDNARAARVVADVVPIKTCDGDANGAPDKNPLSRQHVSQPDKQSISVNEIETKLSKYDSMAREATKQLQEYGLGGFKVIVSWDSEKGFDAFYLKRVGEEDFKYNWIELWDCRYCPNVMALASDAIVAARSLGF